MIRLKVYNNTSFELIEKFIATCSTISEEFIIILKMGS